MANCMSVWPCVHLWHHEWLWAGCLHHISKLNSAFASRILLAFCHADSIPAPQLPTGGNLWAPSSDLCIGIFTLVPRVNSANTMASISTFSILDSPTSLFGTPVTSCSQAQGLSPEKFEYCFEILQHLAFLLPQTNFPWGLSCFSSLSAQGQDYIDAILSWSFISNHSLAHYWLAWPLTLNMSPEFLTLSQSHQLNNSLAAGPFSPYQTPVSTLLLGIFSNITFTIPHLPNPNLPLPNCRIKP